MRYGLVMSFVLVMTVLSFGQAPPAAEESADDLMRPTDVGMRFTPGMARAIAKQMSRQGVFARELGIPEDKADQAAESMARRMMEMAHKGSEQGQAFFEFAFESLMDNNGRFTPDSGRRWAELSKPLIPAFREMMTGMAEDMRPMIPPAKQPAFAGKMLALGVAIDAYEKKMQRWSEGKVGENENPFDNREPDPDKLAAESQSGEPSAVRESRRQAEQNIQWETTGGWRNLVDRAVEYYKLTDAQKQSAESILRELEERAKQMMTEDWRTKVTANRMQYHLGRRGGNLWNTPWMWRNEREYQNLLKPIKDLTAELRDRLEQLPTTEQRDAADGDAAARIAERSKK